MDVSGTKPKKRDLTRLMKATNVCKLLEDDEIQKIGQEALEGYREDVQSRKQWEQRQAEANKLALQIYEEKTFPWPGASSIKFPLITVAALQYHAKAYPSLIDGNDLVYCKVWGDDPTGKKGELARRISTHMSWQNLEEDEGWEADTDRMLLAQPIAGCVFRKRVWEPGPGKQKTMSVMADDLVCNYFTKSLEDSPRYTHRYFLTHNNIKQRVMDGRFRDITVEPANREDDEVQIARDQEQGTEAPQVGAVTPYWVGEQYCWYDFDGDGYQEPYIVTFDINSGEVYRIVARFLPSLIRTMDGSTWNKDSDVYKITPVKVFQKYGFIPSPDGGFYDLGLGTLLGPINAAVNSSFNQIFDLGTLKALGGGFVSRGFRGKGGPITLSPGEWFQLDAPGDDIRKNIMALPTGEAPEILFKVVGFLVQYAERIVSATDLQVGENIGQNTPAQTAQTMNENGRHVYNAIYKRTWRDLKGEFRIQFDLNSLHIEEQKEFGTLSSGENMIILPDDYKTSRLTVCPAADPNATSSGEAIKKAENLLGMAYKLQGFNKYKTTLRYLKAIRAGNIEEIMPPPQQAGPDGKPQPLPDFPPLPNPKMMEAQLHQQEFELEKQDFQLKQKETILSLQSDLMVSKAKSFELMAKAEKELAEAKGVEKGHIIALIDAQLAAEKQHGERVSKIIDTMMKGMEHGNDGKAGPGMAAAAPNPGVPQPAKGNGAAIPAGMGGPQV